MRAGDLAYTTHRNHGHMIARGVDPGRALAEILGREDGLCGGKGGTWHMTDPSKGFQSTSAMVGGSIGLSVGGAFALRHAGKGNIAVALFGDGVLDEGISYEAMNIASLFSLPVLFLCENNSKEGEQQTSQLAAKELIDVPKALRIECATVDGGDAEAVSAAAELAFAWVRNARAPYFLEARLTRWPGSHQIKHEFTTGITDVSMAWDDGRAGGEFAAWNAADPILRYVRSLSCAEGGLSARGYHHARCASQRDDESRARICGGKPSLSQARTRVRLTEGREMSQKSFAVAMIDALACALEEDPQVVVIGASSFLLDRGLSEDAERMLFEKFPGRLIDPPTSEGAVTSLGTGAAVAGMRPFVNYGTATFAYEAYNQILSEAANVRTMSNGQLKAPLVLHMYAGIRGGGAEQHSSSPQAMYANAAGLELVLPASPADAQGLLRSAIRSDNPTVFITHTKLLREIGEVPDGDFSISFGKARVAREGRDVTIVATSLMVREALAAADMLSKDGVEAEVVDPRTIVPLDADAICASVEKTGRLVTADEANAMCSVGSEIAALVAERAFAALKAPILRVARPGVPVPYSPPLEASITPNAEKIAAAARKAVAWSK